jgi:hypothetical protein
MLVVPGNQRIRVFDFSCNRVRTILKDGFDATSMETEIRVRMNGEGPFTELTDSAADCTWFEERIVGGFDLPRCPPWYSKRRLERLALEHLQEWSLAEKELVRTERYTATLGSEVERLSELVRARFGSTRATRAPDLSRILKRMFVNPNSDTVLCRTHGDFQPGNIRAKPHGRGVWIMDWEHAARRSRHYDLLVFGLQTRSPSGLGSRLHSFVSGEDGHRLFDGWRRSSSWRSQILGVFLLEDLVWFLGESLSGPTKRPSDGMLVFLREVESFVRGHAE